MGKIKDFTDLKVWQKSHELVLAVYKITRDFPAEEKFVLVNQMRRAAIPVPANIAEGFKKRGNKNKGNYYNIAQGSLEEVKYYIILSRDLGYIKSADEFISEANEISRMIHGLIESLK